MFQYICSNTHVKQKKATTDSYKNRTYVTVMIFEFCDLYKSTTYCIKQIDKCNTKPLKKLFHLIHVTIHVTMFRGKNPFLLIYILTNAVNGGSVRIRAPMYTGSVEGVTTFTTFRWTSMDTSNRIPRCITTYAFKLNTCTPTKNKLFCFHPIFKSNFFMKTKNANKATCMYN